MFWGRVKSLRLHRGVVRSMYNTNSLKHLLMQLRQKAEKVGVHSFFAEDGGVNLKFDLQTLDVGGAGRAVFLPFDGRR